MTSVLSTLATSLASLVSYQVAYQGNHFSEGYLGTLSEAGELLLPDKDWFGDLRSAPDYGRSNRVPQSSGFDRWLLTPRDGLARLRQGTLLEIVNSRFEVVSKHSFPKDAQFIDQHLAISTEGKLYSEGQVKPIPPLPIQTDGYAYVGFSSSYDFFAKYYKLASDGSPASKCGFAVFKKGKWDAPPVPKGYRNAFGTGITWNGWMIVTLSNEPSLNDPGDLLEGAHAGHLRYYRDGNWKVVSSPRWSSNGKSSPRFVPSEKFPDYEIGTVYYECCQTSQKNGEQQPGDSELALYDGSEWRRLSQVVQGAPAGMDTYEIRSVRGRFVLLAKAQSGQPFEPGVVSYILLRRS